MRSIVFILSIFFCFQSSLFASGAFKSVETKIIEADKKGALVENNPYVPVGSSGIVIRKFDDEHQTVIAKAIVESKSKEGIRIKFAMFDLLKQDALPAPNIMPEKGDTVILNYLYDRAFVIVPNEETFLEITSKYPEIDWIHPDILAAFLSKEYNPEPDREDFQNACKKNLSMLLFFVVKNSGYFVDCNSFKVLKNESVDKKEGKTILPFYSRIGDIESNIFNIAKSKIDNYDNYYIKLLEIK